MILPFLQRSFLLHLLAVFLGHGKAIAEPQFLSLPFLDDKVQIQEAPRYTTPLDRACKKFPDDPFRHCGGGFGIDYILVEKDNSANWDTFKVAAAGPGRAIRFRGHGYGDFVLIKHNDEFVDDEGRSFFTLYAHLEPNSIPNSIPFRVDPHNPEFDLCDPFFGCPLAVDAGTVIGEADQSGFIDCESGNCVHLHFEVFRGGYFLNPIDPYGISIKDQQFTREDYPQIGDPPKGECGPNLLWSVCPPKVPSNDIQPGPNIGDTVQLSHAHWSLKRFSCRS